MMLRTISALILAITLKTGYGLLKENIDELENNQDSVLSVKTHNWNRTISISTNGDKEEGLKRVILKIPKTTTVATSPECLSGGDLHTSIVGITVKGVPIMSPFTEDGCDVATRISGELVCNHKYDNVGVNHHSLFCDYNTSKETDLVGIALDGHPIHGPIADRSELDECNGKVKANGEYGYYLTNAFPYVLGCFRGSTKGSTIELSEATSQSAIAGGEHLKLDHPSKLSRLQIGPDVSTTTKTSPDFSNKQPFVRRPSLLRGVVGPPTATATTTEASQEDRKHLLRVVGRGNSKSSTTINENKENQTEATTGSTVPTSTEAGKARKKRAETRKALNRDTPAMDEEVSPSTSEEANSSMEEGTDMKGKCFYARNINMKEMCVDGKMNGLNDQSNDAPRASVEGLALIGNALISLLVASVL